MTAFTTNQRLALPEDPDLNNVPADMAAYNAGVENRLVQRYSSAVDRGVRNPAPNKGELSYLIDADLHERYDGTTWRNMRGGVDHFYLPGESGTALVGFTNQNSYTMSVSYSTAFSLTPKVFVNINTGAGATLGWIARAFNITTTGFTMYVVQAENLNSSWNNVPVDWVAIGQQ